MNDREKFLMTCQAIQRDLRSLMPMLDDKQSTESTIALLTSIIEKVQHREEAEIPEDIKAVVTETEAMTRGLYQSFVETRLR